MREVVREGIRAEEVSEDVLETDYRVDHLYTPSDWLVAIRACYYHKHAYMR